MIKLLFGLMTLILLSACEEKPFYVADIGNGGSLGGPYSLRTISVSDILDGGAGFGYGAVNGYPGKTADIGKIGVPKHIEGYWAKKYPEGGFQSYYRIYADIDSELAEQKIRTLRSYYKNFKRDLGRMQVVVEQERVQVIYTQGCYKHRMDCSAKENSDPNGWVTRSPSDSTDVVVLFDGKGEMSLTPFEDSPYDK